VVGPWLVFREGCHIIPASVSNQETRPEMLVQAGSAGLQLTRWTTGSTHLIRKLAAILTGVLRR